MPVVGGYIIHIE